jgi:hypothetical protein
MEKIATSLHPHIGVSSTELVGVAAAHLPTETELLPGVHIRRIAGSNGRGNLGRMLRVLLWQPRVYRHYRGQPLAAVAAHNVWVLALCWHLARRAGAPLIYNPHELETEAVAMQGLKKRVARFLEARYITRCAVVSVVNEPIADWYVQHYPIPRPLAVSNVPRVRSADCGLRTTLGVREDEMLYIHTGHLTGGRNIPLILETFAASPHHVVFLGDGRLRGSVSEYSRQHPNIHWMAPVDPDLIVAHVREADVGLCLIEIKSGLSDYLSTPNKLMESLIADRPALCTALVEVQRLLGPSHSSWILSDPQRQLGDALACITKETVAEFIQNWPGLGTWDDEIEGLVSAYSALLNDSQDHGAN